MTRFRLGAAGAAAILMLTGAPLMASAQEPASAAAFAATTLDLSADGEVRAAPDLAVVTVGVSSDGRTAAEALAGNRGRMASVVAVLKAQGVAPADIQTSELSLQAQYADDNGKGPRRLTGYDAANTVTVRLHDLGRTGAVIDALVAAGANQIEGVGFAIDDPSRLEDEARRQAVRTLLARASLYAQAFGYHVGRLVHLSESGGFAPQPMMARAVVVTGARRVNTPVEAGELTVRVSVSAEYELVR